MNFGGSADEVPKQQANPFGIAPSRGATNQQAQVVPYFMGKVRVGVTWLSKPFAETAKATYSSAGKGDNNLDGYNYRADIAGLVGIGPVDALYAVYLNRQLVKGGKEPYYDPIIRRDIPSDVNNPDFELVDLGGFGVMRFYWGTETQLPDFVLGKSGQDHPAYRGFCYVVFDQLFLGFNQTNVQSVELVVSRWPDAPAWVTGGSFRKGTDVFPQAVLYDMATHPRAGLSLSDEFFDQDQFNASAQRLGVSGVGVSPLITETKTYLEWAQTLLQYVDGYVVNTSKGSFGVDVVKAPADADALPVLSVTEMASRPEFSPEDWSKVQSQASVQFTDEKIALQPNVSIYRDTSSRLITGVSDALQVDRSWVTVKIVADGMAKIAGLKSALPGCPGRVTVRKSGTLFEDLSPGNLFKFDYADADVEGALFRVTERSDDGPDSAVFEIAFELDRGYLNQIIERPDLGGGSQHSGDADQPAPVPPLGKLAVIELPLALCPEGKLSLAVLASRSDATTTAAVVWIARVNPSDGSMLDSYVKLSQQTAFALSGVIAVDVVASDLSLEVLLSGVDLDIDEQSFSEACAGGLLLFCGREVLSVASAVVVAANQYMLSVIRGRYATPVEDHAAGADVWLVRREDLNPIAHSQFQPFNSARFKVQSTGPSGFQDLGDVGAIDYLVSGVIYAQTPPTNLSANGSLAGASYAHGGTVSLAWTNTDAGAYLFQKELCWFSTVLEFYNLAGELLNSLEFAAGFRSEVETHDPSIYTSYAPSNADLIALLGSEISFVVKAHTRVESDFFDLSSESVQIQINKV